MADQPPRPLRLVRDEEAHHDRDLPIRTFDELFRRYHRLVATIGLRMLGRSREIDDFVQDVFLEAHRGYGSLRDPAAAKAWLRAIAVRVAVKKLRRHRLAAMLGLDRPADVGPFPVGANQEHAALLSEVYRVLESIPAKARVVWVLRFIEGDKLEEIAEVTGMGLSTVKRHLATATETITEVFGA